MRPSRHRSTRPTLFNPRQHNAPALAGSGTHNLMVMR